jgi:hypothetical protein
VPRSSTGAEKVSGKNVLIIGTKKRLQGKKKDES